MAPKFKPNPLIIPKQTYANERGVNKFNLRKQESSPIRNLEISPVEPESF